MEYNLIEEPFIPVMSKAKANLEYISIRQALVGASDYLGIYDPSPIVTASLYRLLLAVLHRSIGHSSTSDSARFFNQGFPQAVPHYLNTHAESFNLFGPKPFLQNPAATTAPLKPIQKLATELSSASNKTLTDHSLDRYPKEVAPALAARWLIARQMFAIPEGNSYSPSLLGNAAVIIPMGQDLHQTLCLNLVPYEPGHDAPSWERSNQELAGLTDRYTRPCRNILLVVDSRHDGRAVDAVPAIAALARAPEVDSLSGQPTAVHLEEDSFQDGRGDPARTPEVDSLRDSLTAVHLEEDSLRDGRAQPARTPEVDSLSGQPTAVHLEAKGPTIRYMHYAGGIKAPTTTSPDPMVAYREKEGNTFPLRFSEREFWRNYLSLLPQRLASQNLLHALEVFRLNGQNPPVPLLIAGLSNDKASVKLWRMEQIFLSPKVHSDPQAVTEVIAEALGALEDTAKALRKSVFFLAKNRLGYSSEPDPTAVRRLTDSLYSPFYKQLEHPFFAFLEDPNPTALAVFKVALREAALASWDLATAKLGNQPFSHRAAHKSAKALFGQLKNLAV